MSRAKIVLSTITPRVRYVQLGLYNLKSYLYGSPGMQEKFDISVQAYTPEKTILIQGQPFPHYTEKELHAIVRKMVRPKPILVGFSCFLWNTEVILKIAQLLKEKAPETTIVLGGSEATDLAPVLLKKHPFVDFIVRGEGEQTFLEIVEHIASLKSSVKNIRGLSYRWKNRVHTNPDRSLLDLDTVPSPYLNNLVDLSTKDCITIDSSRGCPFSCAYCTFPTAGFNKVRYIRLDKVLQDISHVLKSNPRSLFINDDNFNLHEARAEKILKTILMYRKKTKIEVFVNASVKPISTEIIRLLKKAEINCLIGVQSVNKETLRAINRLNNQPVLEENLRKLDKAGITYSLQFIVGLPNENLQDLERDLDWACGFNPDEIFFSPLFVFRNTELFLHADKYKIKFNPHPPYVFYTTGSLKGSEVKKTGRFLMANYLLYNMGLLRSVLMHINRTYGVKMSSLYKMWCAWSRLVLPERDYISSTQVQFVKIISQKYRVQIGGVLLRELLRRDLETSMSRRRNNAIA